MRRSASSESGAADGATDGDGRPAAGSVVDMDPLQSVRRRRRRGVYRIGAWPGPLGGAALGCQLSALGDRQDERDEEHTHILFILFILSDNGREPRAES
jgi:hypothetical protein